jgi:hypothetical protein
MALLVTTTTNLNRIIGTQKKRPARRFYGLLRLFEQRYINGAGALDRGPALSEGTVALKDAYACEVLPAMVAANVTEAETKIEPVHSAIVPQQWVIAMRLALVSFMMTAWFLSRCYTTTMYLVLGLATATIALQRCASKWRDRGHWIFSTMGIEIMMIVVIYGLVRLRH